MRSPHSVQKFGLYIVRVLRALSYALWRIIDDYHEAGSNPFVARAIQVACVGQECYSRFTPENKLAVLCLFIEAFFFDEKFFDLTPPSWTHARWA